MTSSASVQSLPSWDLSSLYYSKQDPQLQKDIQEALKAAQKFAKDYEGILSTLNGSALADSIKTYEHIHEILGKLMSYGFLLFAEDVNIKENVNFYQSLQEKSNEISSLLLFFPLELNSLEEDMLHNAMEFSSDLRHYEPWLKDVRLFKDHQLAKDLEKILHEKQIASRSNWVRLYEETIADMRFLYNDQDSLAISEILNLFSSPDRSVREKAARAFAKGLKEKSSLFSLISNTLAKDKAIEDTWRKYERPISSRNLANQVEDTVVNTLIQTVKESYPSLSHRYYKLKAKWLGLKKLSYWDRNAPLPEVPEKDISWEEGKSIVLKAYDAFSPQMAKIGERFFTENWIDAGLRPGKDNGAFAHPTVPSIHPYILLNYHGKIRDVMTLAHELGHGIHQVLSGSQGYLLADTPLTIAETASVFGEMLTFQSLLKTTTHPLQRRSLLAGKVEDMLNTVVRQIAFCEFERMFHDQRRQGEVSSDDIGKLWMKAQTESLGSAFEFEGEYSYFWAYISHFIHTPFYVYAYAFGDCLVNSLYATYQKGMPQFEEKYLHMLKAGGTLRHKELLAPFGLNAADPSFWKQGLSMISGFIDDLESLS
jgi:oligoendopeptidase F